MFKSKSGACAAFLANNNQHSFAKVAFGNMHYNLPPWSISILPDCKNTVYNTARVSTRTLIFLPQQHCEALLILTEFHVKVGAQSSRMKMTPVGRGFSWQSYNEETSSYDDSTFTATGLLEQINTTRDASDYLWYMTE